MAQIPPFSTFRANKILRRSVFILFSEKLHPVILITFEISIKTSSRDVMQEVFLFPYEGREYVGLVVRSSKRT